MINEKKLIEEIAKILTVTDDTLLASMIMNCIEHQPKADWIPCSVDLPKKKDKKAKYGRGEYNGTVVNEDGRVFTTSVIYDYINKKWVEEVAGWKVIAWQPLPEPYKEE